MRKTVCITGATSGIGYACAQKFSESGYDLVLIARDQKKLLDVKNKLGKNVTIISTDIGNRGQLDKALDVIKDTPIDILINSAGIAKGKELYWDTNLDNVDEMMSTNVMGTLYITRYILPHMVQRGDGHIVILSSISAERTYPGGNIYCMSKAAINMFVKCLRDELKDTGVKLTNIMPGLVDTHFQLYRFDEDTKKADAWIGGREQLSANEVAETIFSACAAGRTFSNIEIMK